MRDKDVERQWRDGLQQAPQAGRARPGRPTPYRPGARPVAARRRRPVPGWLVLLAALLVLLALGTAGSLDMDEAARQADEYCGNVHEGLWPDYDETYRDRCTADGKPRH